MALRVLWAEDTRKNEASQATELEEGGKFTEKKFTANGKFIKFFYFKFSILIFKPFILFVGIIIIL